MKEPSFFFLGPGHFIPCVIVVNCMVFSLCFLSVDNFFNRRPAPIFKPSNYFESILDLIDERRFFFFVFSSCRPINWEENVGNTGDFTSMVSLFSGWGDSLCRNSVKNSPTIFTEY